MHYHYSGLVLPVAWREILAGKAPLPVDPLVVNFPNAPDCMLVEVRIKVDAKGRRVLHYALLDDGWECCEDIDSDGTDTITLEWGDDNFTVFVRWADDPHLLSYFRSPGVEATAGG